MKKKIFRFACGSPKPGDGPGASHGLREKPEGSLGGWDNLLQMIFSGLCYNFQ